MLKEVYATRLTDYSDKDLEGLGATRVVDGTVYRWVKLVNNTGGIAKGDAVYWSGTNEVVKGTGGHAPAGIINADVPSTLTTAYAWIVVSGFVAINNAGGYTPTNGHMIKSDANGKIVQDTSLSRDTLGFIVNATNKIAFIRLF